jgi:hypothetical protein
VGEQARSNTLACEQERPWDDKRFERCIFSPFRPIIMSLLIVLQSPIPAVKGFAPTVKYIKKKFTFDHPTPKPGIFDHQLLKPFKINHQVVSMGGFNFFIYNLVLVS